MLTGRVVGLGTDEEDVSEVLLDGDWTLATLSVEKEFPIWLTGYARDASACGLCDAVAVAAGGEFAVCLGASTGFPAD